MLNTALFSSEKDDWETPDELFKRLDDKYNFTLDVCANEMNHKCTQWFGVDDDGLSKKWTGMCWMNPPYGRKIGMWIQKAYLESQKGATVVCLIPARTDTSWWHDYVLKGSVTFLRGRVKFKGAKNGAPFPSAIVVFKNNEGANVDGDGEPEGELEDCNCRG